MKRLLSLAAAASAAIAGRAWGAPLIVHASFFGGAGDENVAGVAIAPDGGFVIGGLASPGVGGASSHDLMGGGPGFVARFAADGVALAWIARLPEEVHAVRLAADGSLFVAGTKHAFKLDGAGTKVLATSPTLPGDAADLAVSGDTVGVVAGGWAISLSASGLEERFRVDLKRSRVSSVAVDAQGGLFVGGDNNTNTGFEPYRSPFVLHFGAKGGDADARLYDWPGPAVRDGVELQADSRIDGLTVDDKGQLWFAGGSDGGNTVLAHPARDLKSGQPALAGACYDGPCFNYKGAKHTGMFARIKADFSDMERGTWYVPYYNPQASSTVSPVTEPCGCAGPPLSPNSLTVGGIAFPNDAIAVTGNAGGSIPETKDAWFPRAAGSAYLALFDRDLRTVSFSTFVPGTAGGITTNQPRVDARGGRIVLVGNASSDNAPDKPADPADHKVRFQPTAGAFQTKYGGGDRDGFILVACLPGASCAGPFPPIGPPAAGAPDAGSPAPGSSAGRGAGGSGAAAGSTGGASPTGAAAGSAGAPSSGGAGGPSRPAGTAGGSAPGATGGCSIGARGEGAAATIVLLFACVVRGRRRRR